MERPEAESAQRGQGADSGVEVLRAAARVEDVLHTALVDGAERAGQIFDLTGVDDVRRSEVAGEHEPAGVDVDGDDGGYASYRNRVIKFDPSFDAGR